MGPTPKLFAFDAYGTLFDVHGPSELLRERLGPGSDKLSEIWRTKQLEYSWLHSLMGHTVPFIEVTRQALEFAFAASNLPLDAALAGELMAAYERLPAYPDVADILTTLSDAGCQTAILTNGGKPMIGAAMAHSGLDRLIDTVLSAEDAGIFKPHPSVYQTVLDRFSLAPESLAPEDVCFVSANGWDVAGAGTFGFRCIWLNRFGRVPETIGPKPEAVIDSLALLPDIVF